MSVPSRESYNYPQKNQKKREITTLTRPGIHKSQKEPHGQPPRGSHLSTSKAQKKGKEGEKKVMMFSPSKGIEPRSLFPVRKWSIIAENQMQKRSDLRKTGRATTAPRRA